jgi:hypothetical protein
MSTENMGHKGIIDQWAPRYKGLARQRFLTQEPSRASGSGHRRIDATPVAALGHDGSMMANSQAVSENCREVARVVPLPGGTWDVRRLPDADAVARVDEEVARVDEEEVSACINYAREPFVRDASMDEADPGGAGRTLKE